MDHFHSLLKRQINRYLKNTDSIPDEFIKFLNYVSEAYKHFDDDRELLERSLELSSEELLNANLELRALLSSLPDLIFIIDLNGEIFDCKGGLDSDLIIPRKNYIGKNIFDCPVKEINEKFQEAVSKVSGPDNRTSVEYILNIGGSERYYEARFIRLDNNKILVEIKNYSERVQTEEILMKNFLEISKKNIYESILRSVSSVAHNSSDTQDILEYALDAVYDKVNSVEFISVFNVVNDKTYLKTYRGYPDWFVEKTRVIDNKNNSTWHCITNGQSLHINNLDEDMHLGEAGRKLGIKSYITIPIFLQGSPTGCIHVQSTACDAFDKNDFNFMESLCQQIANSIKISLHAKALIESEERYKTLFEQSPDGICIIDKNFRIIHCNERLTNIFQSNFENILGLDINNLKDKAFVPVVERAFRGEVCSHTSFYEASTSDVKLWLRAKVVPLYEKDHNEVMFVMGVVEDITESMEVQNRLKDNEERFRGIVEHASDLIIEADMEGKLFDFDQAKFSSEGKAVLIDVLRAASGSDYSKIVAIGHTDLAGDSRYNSELSKKRAKTVADFLVNSGIARSDLAVSARGQDEPSVPTPPGQREQKNRRVEVKFLR